MTFLVLNQDATKEGQKADYPIEIFEIEKVFLSKPAKTVFSKEEIARSIVGERMKILDKKRVLMGECRNILEKKMLVDVIWQLRHSSLSQIPGLSKKQH